MKNLLACLLFASCLVVTSCAAKSGETLPVTQDHRSATPAPESANQPVWYWFSAQGIHSTRTPSDIPFRPFQPWTEAIRVSDSAQVDGNPVLLINRLGILSGNPQSPALHREPELFARGTAAALYRLDTGTAVRLYSQSIFSRSQQSSVVLARYAPDTGRITEWISAADFGLSEQAQCVAMDRIGSMWYAAFKEDIGGRVEFTYLEFERFPTSDTEDGNKNALPSPSYRRIEAQVYQQAVSPFSWSQMPSVLRDLLSEIPDTMPLSVRVRSEDRSSAQTYVRDGEGTPLEASAWITDARISALFADGTLMTREGSSGARTARVKLPPLSDGYVYTNFVLSGKTLLASWEEQRFFETGRAGLLEIHLPDTVY